MTQQQRESIAVGDWVCFRKDGALVIGRGEYIRQRNSWESEDTLETSKGGIWRDAVLEVRSAQTATG